MFKYDIVILTEDRFDDIIASDENERDILMEDSLIQKSMEKLGLKVFRTSWSNPNFDWTTTKAAFFSTTWDYFERFEEFSKWFEKVKNETLLINSHQTIKWNLDKHYLKDLEKAGINIPETLFAEIKSNISLNDFFFSSGWENAVLKPIVSGAARHTYRINKRNIVKYKNLFSELLKSEGMMLQEFQENILTKGEVAYMFMGDKFTHAILKKAKPGEFRVQDDFGGTIELYDASEEEIEFAKKTLQNCGHKTVYARVDVIYDNNNKLAVSELELIEPELWFRFNNSAADILAMETMKILNKII
jgi:glutathione synthase/RimK-type ligase-like ATP-grasp enzyme